MTLNHPTVAVIGVLAHAHVGHNYQIRNRRPERFYGLLDDAVFGKIFPTNRVFFGRQPEQNYARNTQLSQFFGFGSQESAQSDRYATERTEFIQTGIPDMGAAGIDTRFELYVLQLFEGAVYFNKTF